MSAAVADRSNSADREMFGRIIGENGADAVPDSLAMTLLNCQIAVHFKTADRLGLPHGGSFSAAAARVLALKEAQGIA